MISFADTVTLFFFLSILEDTGYMARVAFVMGPKVAQDRFVRAQYRPDADRLWLLGSHYHADPDPGVSATASDDDTLLTPFMSCSAKLPIYTLIIGAFFAAKYQALVMCQEAFWNFCRHFVWRCC